MINVRFFNLDFDIGDHKQVANLKKNGVSGRCEAYIGARSGELCLASITYFRGSGASFFATCSAPEMCTSRYINYGLRSSTSVGRSAQFRRPTRPRARLSPGTVEPRVVSSWRHTFLANSYCFRDNILRIIVTGSCLQISEISCHRSLCDVSCFSIALKVIICS